MNVAMWCCHVRPELRVCDVMLQDCMDVAWICMGFVLGGSLGTKPCVFSGKMALAGDERYLRCAAGAAAVVLA